MLRLVSIFLISIFFFGGCSLDKEKTLKISVNSWLGYAPLIYANEKGWLNQYNIKIINVVSLSESISMYNSKYSDAFTGTQYEYQLVKEQYKTLTPLMMFDSSYGGDLVMANRSIEELVLSTEPINTYLEINSVNASVLQDFLSYYKIDPAKIHYINQDQQNISNLENIPAQATLLVTYSPYDIDLKKQNFQTLASTKDEFSITVVDAMYATQEMYLEHKKQFLALKTQTDRAIEVLKNDPKEFYKHVKPFLQDVSFEEFESMSKDIKWINKEIPKNLQQNIQKMDFPLDGLIK
jgi:NitT/TauT family transport system substrate-binding protein